MFIYNRVILRFECKKISRDVLDNDKDFLISFYCGDDSMMIYQKANADLNIQGGKYLEKTKQKNDKTGKYYNTKDLFIG